jgi:hypothetical protein
LYLIRCDIQRGDVMGEVKGEGEGEGEGEGISRAMRSASCPPACGLRLDLRKAHRPTDSVRPLVFDRMENRFLAASHTGFECVRTNGRFRTQVGVAFSAVRSRRSPKGGGHHRCISQQHHGFRRSGASRANGSSIANSDAIAAGAAPTKNLPRGSGDSSNIANCGAIERRL